MRNHVISELEALAGKDERIMLLVADLGYSVVEQFGKKFPKRFINTGIAEQNMAAVAAGLALEGNMVFTYSIGNFPTLRCIEQIRNDICYHNANVKVLAVGGGFAYGDLGMTHHATEDIAMMRALPNMRVYVPSDEIDAVACLRDAVSFNGPAYIRMARGKETVYHSADTKVNVNHMDCFLSAGTDVNILTTGTVLGEGIKLSELLKNCGLSVGLFSIPMLKPMPDKEIVSLSTKSKVMISIEEHSVIGGLGGAIAEILSSVQGEHAVLYRAGLEDTYTSEVGNQEFLRNYYGISAEKIYKAIQTKGLI